MDIFKEPHIRKNILTGDEVLVSPHRTKRPWQGKVEETDLPVQLTYDETCYLCPGNTRASGDVNPAYKDTFVFTNDYAALKDDTETTDYVSGLLEAKGEKGICKVVCFSPNHSLTLSKMEIAAIAIVIETWQREFRELSEIPFINNVQIFENRGDIMGCSNPHPHGQIWAQKSIPTAIQKKTQNFQKYHVNNQHQTLLEAYVAQEIEANERVVYTNEHFVVLVPFWAVWPFETVIVPRRAMKTILEMTSEEIIGYADAIKTITSLYDQVFNVPFPYSAGIHQAPTDNKSNDGWHWHMSFYPPLLRSATVKKFMVGYEMFAMPQRDITAEKAAEMLKNLKTID